MFLLIICKKSEIKRSDFCEKSEIMYRPGYPIAYDKNSCIEFGRGMELQTLLII